MMGIPRLAHLLEPYGVTTPLGHHRGVEQTTNIVGADGRYNASIDTPVEALSSPQHNLHDHGNLHRRNVIIDGPAMVHFVYGRLLSLCDTELPSYHKINQAVKSFLVGLQEYHLSIEAIYFDGALPTSKRPTRIARLESSAKRLAKLKETHPHGFSSTRGDPPSSIGSTLDLQALLSSSKPISSALSAWPVPPFVVPTALDALEQSPFASITKMVPDEADIHCAAHAFTHGGLVLSGDSDLLVFDLGPHGAYLPLASLELGLYYDSHSDKRANLLRGRAFHRGEIEKTLGTTDMVRVAFEVKEDPHVTLLTAIKRAKDGMLSSEAARFSTFKQQYDCVCSQHSSQETFSPTAIALNGLDPRVSEFISQVHLSADGTEVSDIQMYLPLLYEDQMRVSSWAICTEVRGLAYNIELASLQTGPDGFLGGTESVVTEMMRSGPKRIAGRKVAIKTPRLGVSSSQYRADIRTRRYDHLESEARTLHNRLAKVLTRCASRHLSDTDSWRVFCWMEVYSWYVHNGRTPPTTNHLRSWLANRTRMGPALGAWYDIHLVAQLQAVLYSFRMLQQILRRRDESLSEGLSSLRTILDRLTTLVEVWEGGSEHETVEKVVRSLLRDEQDGAYEEVEEEEDDEHKEERESKTAADASSQSSSEPVQANVNTKKKRDKKSKRSQRRKPRSEPSHQSESENMYGVLAYHQ